MRVEIRRAQCGFHSGAVGYFGENFHDAPRVEEAKMARLDLGRCLANSHARHLDVYQHPLRPGQILEPGGRGDRHGDLRFR